MAVPGVSHRQFRSYDGTTIGYQIRGEGPAVVLSNGLGGTFEAYRHIYRQLGNDYRIVSWDYRGLYSSERPKSISTLEISSQVRDLDRLLEIERIDKALFIGWSMGVQINFEYHRMRPERYAGIVAINGTSGNVFHTVFGRQFMSRIIPTLLAIMKWRADDFGALTRYGMGWDGAVPLMQRLGMVAPTVDMEVWNDLAGGFSNLDFSYYSEMLRALGRHDASDVLKSITVPVLVITGDRDALTPVATAERIVREVNNGRLCVVPGGTHYTPVEFPNIVTAALEDFLPSIDWGTGNSLRSALASVD